MAIRTGQINYVMQPNPVTNAGAGGEPVYFPVIQYGPNRERDYLIAEIAQRTAVSATTMKMVNSALTEFILAKLADGNSVTLTDLASFKV